MFEHDHVLKIDVEVAWGRDKCGRYLLLLS